MAFEPFFHNTAARTASTGRGRSATTRTRVRRPAGFQLHPGGSADEGIEHVVFPTRLLSLPTAVAGVRGVLREASADLATGSVGRNLPALPDIPVRSRPGRAGRIRRHGRVNKTARRATTQPTIVATDTLKVPAGADALSRKQQKHVFRDTPHQRRPRERRQVRRGTARR